jgi:hypothetical protein
MYGTDLKKIKNKIDAKAPAAAQKLNLTWSLDASKALSEWA